MSSKRATMSKRARALAGATAISLGGFAVAGFGAWRPAAAYGAGPSPRMFALDCDVEVANNTELQAAVAASVDNSVICIRESISLSQTLVLDDTSVTLVGRDDSVVTLTAPNSDRHINADFFGPGYDSLELRNLTLTGGSKDGRGGSVYVGFGDFRASRVTFTNNTATTLNGLGGAVAVFGGSVAIADGWFEGNSAEGNGGALLAAGHVTLTDTTFSGNECDFQGGAIYGTGAVTTSESDFTNNVAGTNGGAVRAGGDVATSGGTFSGNTANQNGGAIHTAIVATSLTTTNTSFSTNTAATGYGGAISFNGTGAVTIFGGTFGGNTAALNGGAIHAPNAATVTKTSSNFTTNTARSFGGALSFNGSGPVTITGGTFSGNTAGLNGGAIFAGNRSTSLTTNNTSFYDDTAVGFGGALYFNGSGPVTITGGTFSGNTARLSGGAVFAGINATSLSTNTTNFTTNTSTDSASFGGAINFLGNGPVNVAGGTFTANSAFLGGGAIHADDTVTALGTAFSNNAALDGSGGAILGLGPIEITGGTFETNLANDGDGGAVRTTGDVTVDGSTFLGNYASSEGGALYSGGSISADKALFYLNSAVAGGGAIYAFQRASVEYTSFVGNRVTGSGPGASGGAVFARDQADLTNSTFFSNYARDTGAAVSAQSIRFAFVTSVDDTAPNGDVAYVGPMPGIVTLYGSVIAPAVGGGDACSNPIGPGSASNFATDPSCSATFATRASLGFGAGPVVDPATGGLVLIPADGSVLIGAAPSNLVAGVAEDQLEATRGRPPGEGSTTVGAVQVLPILFTAQPANASVTAGGTATFTVAADPGVGTSPVTFQWQTSSDGGATWANASGPGISGATTGTLTVASASAAQNGLLVRAVASDLRPAAANSATATLTVTSTPSPPEPTMPGAPRDLAAVAGNRSAVVTWIAPASTGDFPITTYQVTNDIDDSTCLLTVGPDNALACEVTGLTNGTAYRFRARALTGAGWGPWSEWTAAVIPRKPGIVITGTRDGQRVRATGATTGIQVTQVKTRVRLQDQKDYQTGVPRPVDSDGTFTWQRTTSKKVYLYFTADGIRSNRIIIPARR